MRDVVVELGAPDVGDLIELEALCFDYHWTEEQFLLGLEAGAFKVIGVRRGGILAGYMAFSLIADEMEILNLAVHPDFRRQGLGEALLARSFEICRQSGIAKSFLDVKVSNDPALALYRKFGYKKIGIRKKYYPDTKEDALLFRYDFQNNEA
ncbi:ribosomal protein S18-alanine N-acetyltransferase [Pseudodesulfovibrio thermohalotolerans]|uniref:ribosomal protein S18-alanine N-acetyltransferase n=1 Tax=Pseudodesulfovibrio thermohalotolerans TaxID=2880651 RepID=UPI0022B9E963|nr:ribosomal protein S18-alanine N-acetyltransferase [Pseudodesulfovibrio thermohalotolerans]WFS60896.1 ribosomal protein S18-alanine N-acetyltransferase [Pseudodesulfovibrio thermohalotolerans]